MTNDLVTQLRNSAGVCTRAAPEYEGGVKHLFETTADGFTQAADEIERLRNALKSFVKIADEAATEWDNDNDPRVGKILIALSGGAPGYRSDIDAIHALLSALDVAK